MLPFLIALLFGIIDFGFTFNDWISVRQGGRDGLRQMIVNTNPAVPGGGTWSCTHSGGADPTANPHGFAIECFTKLRVGLDPARTRVKVFFNTTNQFKAGQPVKICVQYSTSSTTGAYSTLLNNKVLDTEVESLIEQDDTTMAPFAEDPLSASGWSASCSQV